MQKAAKAELRPAKKQKNLVKVFRHPDFLKTGFGELRNPDRLPQVVDVELQQFGPLDPVEAFFRIEPVDPEAPKVREEREGLIAGATTEEGGLGQAFTQVVEQGTMIWRSRDLILRGACFSSLSL